MLHGCDYLFRKFLHPKVRLFTQYNENNLRGSNSATIIKTTTTSFITGGLKKVVSANSFQVLALLSTEKSLAKLILLDNHLDENVACLNPAVKSHLQQQVDQRAWLHKR